MAVTNGTVKVVIDIKGQGDGSKVVDEAAKSVKNLKDAASGGVLKGMGDELREATSGASSFKGGLASIKENVLGLPGIIGGIATSAIGMGTALYEALKQPTLWEEFRGNMKAIESQIDHAIDKAKDLAATGARPGTASTGQLGRDSALEAEGLSKIQSQIDDLGRSWEGLVKQREVLIGLDVKAFSMTEKHASGMSAVLAIDRDIVVAEEQMAKLVDQKAQSQFLQKLYTEQTLIAELAHTDALNRSAVAAQVLASTLAPTQMFVGTINGLAARYGKRPGGGGGAPEWKPTYEWEQEQKEKRDKMFAKMATDDDMRRALSDQAAGDDRLKRREARDRKAFKASNDNKADAAGMAEFEGDKRAQSVRDFSAALIDGAPVLDQYSASLGKLTETWAQYAKTGEGMAGAVTASLSAIGKAGAQHIKDERARAGILAIIETGLGFATLYLNPAESAGHFVAAGILGFAAATGIGVGGGKAGGGGSGGGSQQRQRTTLLQSGNGGQSSGPIVNNFSNNNFFGPNKQETAAALYDVLKRQRSAA